MDTPPLFGLVPAGHPLITSPTSQPSASTFLYTIPCPSPPPPNPNSEPNNTQQTNGRTIIPFNHLTVFLLPGIVLPPGSAAAIYASTDPGAAATSFKFLGGIGPGKESAVFKLSGLFTPTNTNTNTNITEGGGGGGVLFIGIMIEDAQAVAQKMMANTQPQTQNQTSQALIRTTGIGTSTSTSTGMGMGTSMSHDQIVLLAQRIIQNAFNFLSGFSGQVPGGQAGVGVEVVPLRAFQDWWRKFEQKIKRDPGFLERGQD
ncbi:hypothetical protein F5Y17DRAFT_382754 [Xylariaceae sp. FL0594]|nr:hypothetical protein F5Y17DRAFT_382754 [Xylariaceae sp. FL0594]